MKKLIFTIFLVTTYYLSQAQVGVLKPAEEPKPLKWYTWNEGYPIAKKKNKILLIDIYTDWCGWCKKMDHDTYSKKEIQDIINKDFIPIKFNPEKTGITYDVDGKQFNNQDFYGMLVQNQMTGYPTTVFLYPVEKKVYLQAGYQDAASFKKTLNSYIQLKDNK